MTKDEKHQRVLDFIKSKNSKYVSGYYEGNDYKYDIECEHGHSFKQSWHKMICGVWCSECGGTKRLTIDTLQSEAIKRGGKLLSTEYKNAKTKMLWECDSPEKHVWSADWAHISRGHWCIECNGNNKPDIQVLRDFAKAKGWELISDVYVNSLTEYHWKCRNGHDVYTAWYSVRSGAGCSQCYGNTRISTDRIAAMADDGEFKLVSTETGNSKEKVSLVCKAKGHAVDMRPNNIQQGQGCTKCDTRNTSEAQKEMLVFLESLVGTDKVLYNRKPLKDEEGRLLELDLHIPSLNVAFEYHSLGFHSARPMFGLVKERNKTIHQKKYQAAKKAGIRLIQIFEDEWRDKKAVCHSIIQNKLGLSAYRISARDCEILDTNNHVDFFKINHIAGGTQAVKAFGLYKNDDMVCCLSLRPPFTTGKEGIIEIARFASKLDTQVIGGFQKLLKSAIEWAKSQRYAKILTYADCRFGSGAVYLKSGFTHVGHTAPNYFYEKAGKRESRFKHRKIDDEALGKTEIEQNAARGWYAIYDAGSERYELSI